MKAAVLLVQEASPLKGKPREIKHLYREQIDRSIASNWPSLWKKYLQGAVANSIQNHNQSVWAIIYLGNSLQEVGMQIFTITQRIGRIISFNYIAILGLEQTILLMPNTLAMYRI